MINHEYEQWLYTTNAPFFENLDAELNEMACYFGQAGDS